MKRVLKNKIYLAILFSDMLSNFGDIMYTLAISVYVLDLDNPGVALAIVSLFSILPTVLSLFSGYLADHLSDKLRLIKGTQVFRLGLYVLIGIVMRQPPALWILVLAQIISLLATFVGQIESGLFIPLDLRIVTNEDRESSLAFRQSVSMIVNLGSQTISAVLIGRMTYSQLAFANAGTFGVAFLVMVIVTPTIKYLLVKYPITQKYTDTNAFQVKMVLPNLYRTLREAIAELSNLPGFGSGLVVVPMINAFFAILPTIVVLMISQDKTFRVCNPAVTLTMINMSFVVGMMVGGLAISLFKNVRLPPMLILSTAFMTLVFLGLTLHQPFVMLIFLVFGGIVSGGMNPKFMTLIYNNLPEERLATLEGGIYTFLQMGTVVMRLLVSALVVIFSATQLALLFFLLSLLLLGYTCFKKS